MSVTTQRIHGNTAMGSSDIENASTSPTIGLYNSNYYSNKAGLFHYDTLIFTSVPH